MKTLLIAASASLLLTLACGGTQTRADDPAAGGAPSPTTPATATTAAPRGTVGCLATAAPAGKGWLGIEAPTLMGALTEAQVVKVVSSCQQRFLKCYQDELAHHATFHGEIDLTYTIEASGKVDVAIAGRNTCPSDAIGPCVVKTMEAIRFPASADSSNVEQTFKFAEVEPAADTDS